MKRVLSRLSLRTVLRVIGVFLLFSCILGYVLFQARNLIEGPILTITEEPTNPISTRMITIRGIAKNAVYITINGKEMFVDHEGNFTKTLVLQDGYTIMKLRAEDRYGRETTVTREYVLSQKSS